MGAEIKPGELIGGGSFRVRRVLEGGFSQVIIAEDWAGESAEGSLLLAIKRVREDRWESVGDKNAVLKQIKKEALVWQTKLKDCPHTAELRMSFPDFFGLGPVIIMEVVDGPSLQALRTGCGRLSVNQTVRIAREVSEALSFAHNRGVQHRDLSPSNILLTKSNHVKVIDWGLSSVKGSAGHEAFTPGYASPQREGEPSLSDPRDDVFAFGALLYNCLTGKLPVRRSWAREEVESGLLAAGQHIPAEVVHLAAKCLERDPAARPEFADIHKTLANTKFRKEITKWEQENTFCKGCDFIGATPAEDCPICGAPMWNRIPQPPRSGMVRVRAGWFVHGITQEQLTVSLQAAGHGNVQPDQLAALLGDGVRKVFLPAFDIDIYPVTNSQYLEFCQELKYPAHESLAGSAQTRPDHPVVHVNWKDALCYALWASRRLPSPVEWEKAARGDGDDRLYPWGSVWQKGLCNNAHDLTETQTTPVDHYTSAGRDGRSPFGVADMVGNVSEWVSEGSKHGMKAVRGGSWGAGCIIEGLVSQQTNAAVDYEGESVGFRCASDVVYEEVLVKEDRR